MNPNNRYLTDKLADYSHAESNARTIGFTLLAASIVAGLALIIISL